MTKPADVIIANQTSTNARTDINNVNVSLVSNFTRSWNGTAIGTETTEPTQIYSNMWWSDTDNNLLKIRNDGNDAWISVAYLDQTNDKFRILDDTQVVDTSGNQTGLLGDQLEATWIAGTGITESLVSPAKIKAAVQQFSASVGSGQVWQDLSSSRALNTTYQNTTGVAIYVSAVIFASGGKTARLYVGQQADMSDEIRIDSDKDNNNNFGLQGIIPDDYYYKIESTDAVITTWAELR